MLKELHRFYKNKLAVRLRKSYLGTCLILQSLEHNNSYVRCHIYRLSQIPKSTALAGVLAGSRGWTAAVPGARLRGRAGDPTPVSVPVPWESTRRCPAVQWKRKRARSAWGQEDFYMAMIFIAHGHSKQILSII